MKRFMSVGFLAAAITGSIGIAHGREVSLLSSKEKPQNMQVSSEVKIDNFSFSPATLAVPVGTTVTWTNRDDIPHTVVSTDDPKPFKSKVLDTDEKFSYTFSKAGTYPYFCSVHPKMTGKVIVQ